MITVFALPACEIVGVVNRGHMSVPKSIELMDVETDGADVDNTIKKDARDRRHPKGQQRK